MLRAENMLLGVAVGDTFGAGYEFLPGGREAVAHSLDLSRYRPHPKSRTCATGVYTDDTQMSIAVAEQLLGHSFSREALAQRFVDCYRRDPIDGYARGFQGFLDGVADGEAFLARIRPHSTKNGAAMRSVPLGVLPSVEDVIRAAQVNASLTHDTPRGVASSVAVAVAAHYTYHGLSGSIDAAATAAEQFDKESAAHYRACAVLLEEDPQLLFGDSDGIPCDGMRTVGAVFHLLRNCADETELLRRAVLLGGDTDSVAAITLGAFLAGKEENTLPQPLIDGLADGPYGRTYIQSLGRALGERFPSRAER